MFIECKVHMAHSSSVKTSNPKTSRTDRKEATRRRILLAALKLVEEGRSPDGLGLREVARAADMAAPSIYNHFADMDELGLALVDDGLARLRAIARAARKQMTSQGMEQALSSLLQQFLHYITEYEAILRLLIMQWFNPNPEYRRTIRREMSIMRQDLADNMRQAVAGQAASAQGDNRNNFELESDAVFSLLITYILNAMDLSMEKRLLRLQKLEKQLLMMVFGSRALNP
jgi:AcrR family transcriptional regulator